MRGEEGEETPSDASMVSRRFFLFLAWTGGAAGVSRSASATAGSVVGSNVPKMVVTGPPEAGVGGRWLTAGAMEMSTGVATAEETSSSKAVHTAAKRLRLVRE